VYYNVPVTVSKQEDGLWRAVAPSFQGCFVDAPTLERAVAEIQGGIAMYLDLYLEEGRPLPEGIVGATVLPATLLLTVVPSEHPIRRRQAKRPLVRR